MSKSCKRCHQEKSEDEYYTGRPECKVCTNKRRTEQLKAKYNPENMDMNDVIICRCCKESKPRGMFEFKKRSCIECNAIPISEKARRKYETGKEGLDLITRKCIACLEEKPGTDFYSTKTTCIKCLTQRYHDGKHNVNLCDRKICGRCGVEKPLCDYWYRRNLCKLCDRQYHIEWCQKNPERLRYHLKKYREMPESMEKKRKYRKDYFQNNPIQKVIEAYRGRIRALIKDSRSDSDCSIDWLGCSIDFFKKWLEYNFTNEMTWENHGTYWHLDHITPCASFDFYKYEDRHKCFHWSNIAPLEAKENIIKHKKILHEHISFYKDRAEQFLTETLETEEISGASSTND